MSRTRLAFLVALLVAACAAQRSEPREVSDAGIAPSAQGDASAGPPAPEADASAREAKVTPAPNGADAGQSAQGLGADAGSGQEAGPGRDADPPAPAAQDGGDAALAGDAQMPSAEAGCQDCCPDGRLRGKADDKGMLRRLAAFTPSPTDVTTCPDGRVFLTLDGPDQVVRIPESGAPELYADVTGVQPAGIACDARGRLFVIAIALRQGSPYSAPGVLLIEDEHAAPRMLPPASSALLTPNGIAAAHGLGLYATDTLGGVVALIREQNGELMTTVVARDMVGVNGVAFDGAARKLYVSNSLFQEVTSFAVAADGTLSSKKVEWTASGLAQLDGLIVDELGQPYVAAYGVGDVLRLPQGTVVAKVSHPASLAFRGGALLVVDYHLGEPMREGGLYTVDLGVCGAR